jgi:hypothetical protein
MAADKERHRDHRVDVSARDGRARGSQHRDGCTATDNKRYNKPGKAPKRKIKALKSQRGEKGFDRCHLTLAIFFFFFFFFCLL